MSDVRYPILPPFILRHIARAGDILEKRAARATLARDRQIRAARIEMQAHALDHAAPEVTIVRVPGERKARTRGLQRSIHVFRPHVTPKLPGRRIRSERRPPCGDPAADEAYEALGTAYHFFKDAFARKSVDDDDMPLVATVHYNANYNNAFWNGEQMVFGDGDGRIFQRFTGSLEIVGHELTHGIMQFTAQMQYTLQAGAIHESICDVMGVLLKQWSANQTADRADWLIGTGLLMPGVQGIALRSMRDPGTAYDDPVMGRDPQPAHMDDFKRTSDDNGGVHINSGIPNRAFYLAATAIGGYAWAHAGRIWYATLLDKRLRPHWGFKRFARLTIQNAEALYGAGLHTDAVRAAWTAVGIEVE